MAKNKKSTSTNVVIKTKRTALRQFTESDADDLFEFAKNPKIGKMAGWKPHADIEESKAILKEVFLGKENMFAIEYNGKVVGSVGFSPDKMRENANCLMLGYALSEDCWGKGIMPECSEAVINYGFNTLKLDLISITCYTDNLQSKRVIEKCGFTFEGVIHHAEKMYDGEIKDKYCFYLTKESYQNNAKNR
ncbi:MAG: GNAT family protein [Clostridia bacterium]